jgi:dephospho-CoA kinase
MRMILKLAVTGGMACGKSSFCKFLKKHGAYTLSADAMVHDLLDNHEEVQKEVLELCGDACLINGKIDRTAVGDFVFKNKKRLKKLETILYSRLSDEREKIYDAISMSEEPPPILVVEVPLLYEKKKENEYDAVVVVLASPTQCAERFAAEKNLPIEEYDRRMGFQMDPAEKAELADYVVLNNGSKEQLEAAADQLWEQLLLP